MPEGDRMAVGETTTTGLGWWRIHWPVLLTVGTGTVISVVLFLAVRTWERQQIESQFVLAAKDRVAALERELIYCLGEIEQIGGFFAGSENVTREEFHEYTRRLPRGLAGGWTIRWVPRVPQSERSACEQAARREGPASFSIFEQNPSGNRVPAAQRPEYYPIFYAEPPEDRGALLGLDLGSEAGQLEVLLKARDSGGIAVSQQSADRANAAGARSLLVVLPVFRRGLAIESLTDRRENLEGFVVGTFPMRSLMDRAVGAMAKRSLMIIIRDRAATSGDSLVWSSEQAVRTPPGATLSSQDPVHARLAHSVAIDVGDRRWLVTCTALPAYEADLRTWNEWSVLALGLLLTGVVANHLRTIGAYTRGLVAVNERLTREIEDRRRMEAALREANDRVSRILDSISDGFFAFDNSLVFTYFNKAAERLLGRRADDVLGQSFLGAFPQVRGSVFEENIVRAVAEKTSMAFEAFFDREPYTNWYDIRVYPLEQGLAVYFEVTTERKRVEEELARHRSHLEELVAERTAQLEDSRARLVQSERLASIGTLASGIAHEINNPVGTMMLAAENALELRKKPGTETLVEDCLRGIVSEARRCGDVIRSVLQFACHERTHKWICHLNTVILKSVGLTATHVKERGAAVETDLSQSVGDVVINPLQMGQVFINLIRNAVDADPRGVQVRIRSEPGPEGVRITVQDSGPGISEEHLRHIFDPFFTTRRERGGTGLGLSLVHGIIAEHGGTISVQSRLGAGTSFVIDLPVTAGEPSEDSHVADTPG